MDIQLKKWGNSLSLCIPDQLAESFGLDETSLVEIIEINGSLVIRKKPSPVTLNELLNSIPDDFSYPEDVQDFTQSSAVGQESL